MLKNILAICAVAMIAVSCNKAPTGYAPYSVSNVPWGGQDPFSATTNGVQVFKPNSASYLKLTAPTYIEFVGVEKNMDSNLIDRTYIKRSYQFSFLSAPALGTQIKCNNLNTNTSVSYIEERISWDSPADTTKTYKKTYISSGNPLSDLHITVVKNDTVFRAFFEGALGRLPSGTGNASTNDFLAQLKEDVHLENGYISIKK
jgi:hypothetical protein